MTDTSPVPGDGPTERERPCPFCDPDLIAAEVTTHRASGGNVVMTFEPLNPVTPGHVLVVPVEHVESAAASPLLTGEVAEVAARIARDYASANIITSIGADATQTVRHLHLHVVPREAGDGLALPWAAARTPAPSAAQALAKLAADLFRDHDAPPRDHGEGYRYRNGWWDGVHHAAKVARDCARRLDAAPTDPGTRDVLVRVYDEEPGPEVTEVEDREGHTWQREGDEWRHGGLLRTWAGAAQVYGPLGAVGNCARLRTPGTEGPSS